MKRVNIFIDGYTLKLPDFEAERGLFTFIYRYHVTI